MLAAAPGLQALAISLCGNVNHPDDLCAGGGAAGFG
jgi:hypothetical protein